ncbi:hypothetical protein K466DRAFT_477004 [Polyporus arcularius HHB13444]|uniref:Uncharacterized protein n=1 Tax=Polyporus arcularius HHB13444 TaxID=1314778 RepID=A0A5C3PWT4_9APHY|nr:hypothetical protein K466DRAFT_477004 [Polyporus arcularius HHB13444]
MASSLEEELKKSSHVAHSALEIRRKELAEEEEDIADSRIRYETERMLDFYDELSDRKVAEEVAAIIQRFVSLEKVVGEATTAGLRLTSLPYDETTDIQRYNDALDTIGGLEDECQELEADVLSLCGTLSSTEGRLPGVLDSLLDILRGHTENLTSAQSLVRCCKESYRMGIGTLTLV